MFLPGSQVVPGLANKVGVEVSSAPWTEPHTSAPSPLFPGTSWGKDILCYVTGVNGVTLMGAMRHLRPWPSCDAALVCASGASFGEGGTGPAVGDSAECTGRGGIMNIPSISLQVISDPHTVQAAKHDA